MLEYLKGYLDKGWKKREHILYFLNKVCGIKIEDRTLRLRFEEINKQFAKGESELFIASSEEGYLLTTDPEIILKSLDYRVKRAFTILRMYYRCKKTLSERNQLSLSADEATVYEIVSKMEDQDG